MVRRLLLDAAAAEVLAGAALPDCLFVPQTFHAQRREVQHRATRARNGIWRLDRQRGARPLLLLVGELKELRRARGCAIGSLKHLPRLPLLLNEALFADLCSKFGQQLSEWTRSQHTRMLVIATFMLAANGMPRANEIALMPTNWGWVPADSELEHGLIDKWVRDRRHFRKRLWRDRAQAARDSMVDFLDNK